jgi:outer membrane protein OmpA-like peptidoglycan-associated protein
MKKAEAAAAAAKAKADAAAAAAAKAKADAAAAEAKKLADAEAAKKAAATAQTAAPAEDPEAEKKRAAERAAEGKRLLDLYAPLTAAWNKEQASDYAASVKQADAEMLAWRKADAAERAKAAEVKPAPAPAPAPEPRKAEAQACQAKLRDVAKAGTILFATGKADINPKSQTTINDLAAAAKGCPGLTIRVEGHTDSQGEASLNQTLSENRAKAIADALAKAGVEQARLDAVGFGETKPVAPNDGAENRAKNRRIEFVVE